MTLRPNPNQARAQTPPAVYRLAVLLLAAALWLSGCDQEPAPINLVTATAPGMLGDPTTLGQANPANPAQLAGETEGPPLQALRVEAINAFPTPQGEYTIIGVVNNPLDVGWRSVLLELVFKNDAGEMVATAEANLTLDTLAPGGKAPFSKTFDRLPPGTTQLVIEAIAGETFSSPIVNIAVARTNLVSGPDGALYLAGELVNRSEEPVEIQAVAGMAYSANEILLAAGLADVFPSYLDGAGVETNSAPFRIALPAAAGSPARMEAWVQAVPAQPRSIDIGLSEFRNYLSAAGELYMTAEVTNLSTHPLQLRLLAGVYAQDGAVLDAATARLPFEVLLPGASLPVVLTGWRALHSVPGLYTALAHEATFQVEPLPGSENPPTAVTLRTNSEKFSIEGSSVFFSGVVSNPADVPAERGVVVAFLRDAETGLVRVVGIAAISGRLEPGQSQPYSLTVPIPPGLDPANLEHGVLSQGIQP